MNPPRDTIPPRHGSHLDEHRIAAPAFRAREERAISKMITPQWKAILLRTFPTAARTGRESREPPPNARCPPTTRRGFRRASRTRAGRAAGGCPSRSGRRALGRGEIHQGLRTGQALVDPLGAAGQRVLFRGSTEYWAADAVESPIQGERLGGAKELAEQVDPMLPEAALLDGPAHRPVLVEGLGQRRQCRLVDVRKARDHGFIDPGGP